MKQVVMRVAPFPIRPLIEGRRRAGITPERWHSARSPWSGMGHLRPAGFCQRESAHPRKASATLIIASRFFSRSSPHPRRSMPAPVRRCDTSTRREPHAAHTKRRAPAMAGNAVSGARPIAAKAMGVDRRQTGLQHVTHTPATPWDWRSAIVGGTIIAVSRLKLP